METLIEGNTDKKEKLKYFECNECGWVGTATKDEYKSGQQYNETYYYVACPFCNKSADEVLNKEKLQQYKTLKKQKDIRSLEYPYNPEDISFFK